MKHTIFANLFQPLSNEPLDTLLELYNGEHYEHEEEMIKNVIALTERFCLIKSIKYTKLIKVLLFDKVVKKMNYGHPLATSIALVKSRIKSDLYYIQISKPA